MTARLIDYGQITRIRLLYTKKLDVRRIRQLVVVPRGFIGIIDGMHILLGDFIYNDVHMLGIAANK